MAEIVNSVYGANTVTANYVQFWFRRFRSGIFDVKDAPSIGRPSWKMSIKSQKYSKLIEAPCWMPHQFTPKNMRDRTSNCEVLAKRNETDPFLKRMVPGDENIVRKQSWLKHGGAAQTVAKPGLTARKVLLCIWWDWK
ncbi:putative DD34D transposase [Trichonephila clavipes]|nr:putative DD34D transposase [Trichonephila clavipes]